ncbi:MAG: Transcription termination factor Rho [Candidatus Uhrbacteria bacterium GW2011_GWD2_41_121]|uniref:Transcription termination factor Rho n=1 Tax=Candidatus Uhrbacteria bacterium GW2011_GWC1_41_20 TaxID=1618983 RepID=A0A0G0VK32_9BACT|nr:MAG: Transcription termination factor Rho [Candidatus Uhrbacteria bacterium GW2011_GWE1_39_46]KKR64428.1 MAG: Transcription termination factor Rho [Candidatus Uhrbacteria bacterium GW2011_GWC2_40_450]KKR90693.1 MAG: Transcription termination factor Rho [Candidatus Uhrbacteria bacterium GW2011_GWD2_41_121]KKR96590.1 MAG: Transcription termination factor Rho [Candidatus Uhrbacteria bacterium GW2011_GWD1_41_16]KKR99981.1 MAG: Transcription termination factor Rho [Candidatus Uhrbacteria bacteriu
MWRPVGHPRGETGDHPQGRDPPDQRPGGLLQVPASADELRTQGADGVRQPQPRPRAQEAQGWGEREPADPGGGPQGVRRQAGQPRRANRGQAGRADQDRQGDRRSPRRGRRRPGAPRDRSPGAGGSQREVRRSAPAGPRPQRRARIDRCGRPARLPREAHPPPPAGYPDQG